MIALKLGDIFDISVQYWVGPFAFEWLTFAHPLMCLFWVCYPCCMQLLTITMVNMLICDWFVVSAGKLCADLPLFCLLSLRDLMRHWHMCKLSPAGLLLILRPPCESTLYLSLPIIPEHYWLLMCLSTLPQISKVIMNWTNNPLCSYLVITARNTPLF